MADLPKRRQLSKDTMQALPHSQLALLSLQLLLANEEMRRYFDGVAAPAPGLRNGHERRINVFLCC